jgi:hypothetical protein
MDPWSGFNHFFLFRFFPLADIAQTSWPQILDFHRLDKYLTSPAQFHFFGPALLDLSLADCPIDEPADTDFELPRGTSLALFRRTIPMNLPARTHLAGNPLFGGQ